MACGRPRVAPDVPVACVVWLAVWTCRHRRRREGVNHRLAAVAVEDRGAWCFVRRWDPRPAHSPTFASGLCSLGPAAGAKLLAGVPVNSHTLGRASVSTRGDAHLVCCRLHMLRSRQEDRWQPFRGGTATVRTPRREGASRLAAPCRKRMATQPMRRNSLLLGAAGMTCSHGAQGLPCLGLSNSATGTATITTTTQE